LTNRILRYHTEKVSIAST